MMQEFDPKQGAALVREIGKVLEREPQGTNVYTYISALSASLGLLIVQFPDTKDRENAIASVEAQIRAQMIEETKKGHSGVLPGLPGKPN